MKARPYMPAEDVAEGEAADGVVVVVDEEAGVGAVVSLVHLGEEVVVGTPGHPEEEATRDHPAEAATRARLAAVAVAVAVEATRGLLVGARVPLRVLQVVEGVSHGRPVAAVLQAEEPAVLQVVVRAQPSAPRAVQIAPAAAGFRLLRHSGPHNVLPQASVRTPAVAALHSFPPPADPVLGNAPEAGPHNVPAVWTGQALALGQTGRLSSPPVGPAPVRGRVLQIVQARCHRSAPARAISAISLELQAGRQQAESSVGHWVVGSAIVLHSSRRNVLGLVTDLALVTDLGSATGPAWGTGLASTTVRRARRSVQTGTTGPRIEATTGTSVWTTATTPGISVLITGNRHATISRRTGINAGTSWRTPATIARTGAT
ncbi:MAG: hypothetical protein ACO1QR_07960 [Chthoniobacteraceae bacterium]